MVALVEETLKVYGTIDMLVNNAGIVLLKNSLDTSLDEWSNIVNINLRGVWLCSRYVLPTVLAKGTGSIVNIASVHGLQTLKDMTAYASTKGGVLAMTRAMALDHAPKVRVNSILPGYIATNMWQKVLDTTDDPEKLTRDSIAVQPMGRLGTPMDVARGALFFASDESEWITGTSLTICRAHVPRIRTDADDRGRHLGYRLADADADDVFEADEAYRGGICRSRASSRSPRGIDPIG